MPGWVAEKLAVVGGGHTPGEMVALIRGDGGEASSG